ncbi:hypothetical protein [Profundibacterium mesophilum]|uniref:Uncharacterized protein n=1 Tax=Profundibacterium mesophilum KAUST100406-0324 TaxID=1037889 RepID=A0A921TFZ4_9RHOB|nr:hypothetical protein [Profundibacterium mesophilum]KAF0676934.1 hypothetical protein PMES_00731 [Profundibacterium mesophilum KAUST100406-0324]
MSAKKQSPLYEAPGRSGMRLVSEFSLPLERRLLGFVVAVDLFLIALHIVTGATLPAIPRLLNISFDFSLAETFGYGKWIAIIVLLLAAYRHRRLAILPSMAAVFTLMLLDDSLQIHERLGAERVEVLNLGATSWAKAQDIGEILVWGLMAALVLPIIAIGFVRSNAQGRRIGVVLVALIGLYAVFGGIIDVLHQPFTALPYGIQIADLLEDGGEMIVGSLILAHVAALSRHLRRAPPR